MNKRSGKDAGRREKTAGNTPTPILTYKSVLALPVRPWRVGRSVLSLPLIPICKQLLVLSRPQAQEARGWSKKRRQMEGAGTSLLEVSKEADCIFAF